MNQWALCIEVLSRTNTSPWRSRIYDIFSLISLCSQIQWSKISKCVFYRLKRRKKFQLFKSRSCVLRSNGSLDISALIFRDPCIDNINFENIKKPMSNWRICESICLKYSPITRNPGSNFSSGSNSIFRSKWLDIENQFDSIILQLATRNPGSNFSSGSVLIF